MPDHSHTREKISVRRSITWPRLMISAILACAIGLSGLASFTAVSVKNKPAGTIGTQLTAFGTDFSHKTCDTGQKADALSSEGYDEDLTVDGTLFREYSWDSNVPIILPESAGGGLVETNLQVTLQNCSPTDPAYGIEAADLTGFNGDHLKLEPKSMFSFTKSGVVKEYVLPSSSGGFHVVPSLFAPAYTYSLGLPTSAMVSTISSGLLQHFQNGSIYYSPSTGVHVVLAKIRSEWSSKGWEKGVLGFPVSDQFSVRNGGVGQHFQGGSIYSAGGSAPVVSVIGSLRDVWAKTGWENGPLGYPSAEETTAFSVRSQQFNNGSCYATWSEKGGGTAYCGDKLITTVPPTLTAQPPEVTAPPSPPSTPQGLKVDATTANSVGLSWNPAPGADGYHVHVSTGQSITTAFPQASIGGLTSNTTYSFTVTAYNKGGESSPSGSLSATTLPTYLYSVVSQTADSDVAHARPGQVIHITIKVRNTGTATWSNSGANPVMLGTIDSRDHNGLLKSQGWISNNRPARLQEATVAPSEIGTFSFPVMASGNSGKVTEHYTLVAEGRAWFNDAGTSVSVTTISIVGVTAAPGTNGFWTVASDGGVFTNKGAPFYGSMGGQPLNARVVGIASTPSGHGYWLVGADGGVFAFGDARFAGSMAGRPLTQPIAGMVGTPSGHGYWLVGTDGGVFAFGDAQFYGSMAGKPLNAEMVGIAATSTGRGYWLVGADGGVFAFGDARFAGSMAARPLNKAVVGIALSGGTGGYWLVGADGGIYAFGSAPFLGSAGATGTIHPTVGMTATPSGYLTVDDTGNNLAYSNMATAILHAW